MPDQPITLRPVQPSDAAELARLAGELGYPTAPREMADRLEPLLADPGHYVVVAAGERGLLGWAHVERRRTVETPERAELMGLVVDSRARRSGVGRRLVRAAEQWAADEHLGEIAVRSNVIRSESHPFYQKAGYARAKTQHVYVKKLTPGEKP